MTKSDWETPPDDSPSCMRCHDIISQDDRLKYAELCDCCYDNTVEDMDDWGRHLVSYLESRVRELSRATGAKE